MQDYNIISIFICKEIPSYKPYSHHSASDAMNHVPSPYDFHILCCEIYWTFFALYQSFWNPFVLLTFFCFYIFLNNIVHFILNGCAVIYILHMLFVLLRQPESNRNLKNAQNIKKNIHQIVILDLLHFRINLTLKNYTCEFMIQANIKNG